MRISDGLESVEPTPVGLKKDNTAPAEPGGRRTVKELIASIDPSVEVEPEVEDFLLEMADEFVDSVTHFACRVAKHRGSDTLDVKDLQLHLERNHNIRVPGFASDETRLAISQSTAVGVPIKPQKGADKTVSLRGARLAAVRQARG